MSDSAGATRLERQARLANLRQELLAPVNAILGYGDMLHEDVEAKGPAEISPDLDRILAAARELHQMVDRLLDTDHTDRMFEGQDNFEAEKKLRHDLRTPINGIKGYGEMLLEDLEDVGAGRLRGDLGILVDQSNKLLSQIDTIVNFSRDTRDGLAGDQSSPAAGAAMFVNLAASIHPISAPVREAAERGHILVVDDLETNRSLLERRLTRDGHQVTTAHSGRRALDLMAVEEFDLVLLDLMMPEMNGFEALAHLKADERLYWVPVIMISALDEIDSVVRCIEAGAEDYLPKPFNPVLLKARINAALEKKRWRERERDYLDRLESEKEKFESLLLNILPQQIVGRLNDGETIIADRYNDVSVLFSDLVGFTKISSEIPPTELVTYLNTLFSEFDTIARDLKVEKIKMIGDAYMVVAGAPEPRADHADAIANMALRMVTTIEQANRDLDITLKVRIGIHSGPVVAGIIGTHRFLYDVWGDTVNVASRLESHSLPNRIQVSDATAGLLQKRFELEPRGAISVKGKGKIKTHFITGAKAETNIS